MLSLGFLKTAAVSITRELDFEAHFGVDFELNFGVDIAVDFGVDLGLSPEITGLLLSFTALFLVFAVDQDEIA